MNGAGRDGRRWLGGTHLTGRVDQNNHDTLILLKRPIAQ
jgi:hypothetical protein